jgi:hypothetical protein
MELLRWDVWGAMVQPGEYLPEDRNVFFDRLTALTREPNQSFDQLRNLYEQNERLAHRLSLMRCSTVQN